jgi:hypothetical protein
MGMPSILRLEVNSGSQSPVSTVTTLILLVFPSRSSRTNAVSNFQTPVSEKSGVDESTTLTIMPMFNIVASEFKNSNLIELVSLKSF